MKDRPEMEARVLAELRGGLWHTTHPDRYERILSSGAIVPNPDIPDSDRWKTSRGSDCYPYVRVLGGVSLFDFDQFDPVAYRERCPMCSRDEFVPYSSKWRCAVWIEIDRQKVASRFISGLDLMARQRSEKAERHTLMPYIEAAHLGPVQQGAFKRAFEVREGDPKLRSLPV